MAQHSTTHCPSTSRLLFGTSGVPESSPKHTSEAGILQSRALGLDCMEMAMVQKVTMGPATAAKVKAIAERERVALSIHAPYYINLNSQDPQKLIDSQGRILAAARAGDLCGARNIVVHMGFYHTNTSAETTEIIYRNLKPVVEQLQAEGSPSIVRPETMGRLSQWGDLDEVLDLCAALPGVLPCLDFAHLYARHQGGYNTYTEFLAVLDRLAVRLGRAALNDMHIHVSGIEYGQRGEVRHLTFAESAFNYRDCVRALRDRDCKGLVIGESPDRERDAIFLQGLWKELILEL